MALVIKDRIKETSTTTGTGTLTLAGASTGFKAFSEIGSGNTTYYAISDGTDWEVGLGTVGSGTLSRDTILASSNSGLAVSWNSDIKDVFCTYPAEKAVYLDASGNFNISDGDIKFGDNDKAVFGAGSDLQIYHNGTQSIIEDVGTGPLRIRSNSISIENELGTETISALTQDGAVTIYYDGSPKLATTSTGIDVTGTVTADGLTVAGNLSVDGGTIKLDGNYPVGTYNVALGDAALDSGSLTGGFNVAVGTFALTNNTSGSTNTAVGQSSVEANTTGGSNTGIGQNALKSNTTGSSNTSIGKDALRYNTTGNESTAIGRKSLENNTTANYNTAVGYASLNTNTTGGYNVAAGNGALQLNTSGSYNVALGLEALRANTTASNNTAVGYQAAYSNTTGTNNTAVGVYALSSNTTASDNTALGRNALESNTTGTANTAVGKNALDDNTTGSYNTAVGYRSLFASTTANYNTAVGYQAGYSSVTTSLNTTIGYRAGFNNTGSSNVLVGSNIGSVNVMSGSYNTALGDSALRSNSSASNNTAVGRQALQVNTTGTSNTAVGNVSGYSNTSGADNTFIGDSAGYFVTTGSKNTIIGRYSGNSGGLDIRTSSNNIILSDGDGTVGAHWRSPHARWDLYARTSSYAALLLNNTSAIPYGPAIVFTGAAPDNNTQYFLNCSDTGAERLIIWSDGDIVNHDNSYGAISDVKLKEQITDASSQWDDIKALTVRKYKMKSDVADKGDSDELWRLGVIAQEVEAAGMSGLIKESPDRGEGADGQIVDLGTTTKEVKYSILYMKAVKALQEAMERIETLEAKVSALESA